MKYLLFIVLIFLPMFSMAQLQPDLEAQKVDDKWYKYSKTEQLIVNYDNEWRRSFWFEALDYPISLRQFDSNSAAEFEAKDNLLLIVSSGKIDLGDGLYPTEAIYLIKYNSHDDIQFTFIYKIKKEISQEAFGKVYDTLVVNTLKKASLNKEKNSQIIKNIGSPTTLKDYFIKLMFKLESPQKSANYNELVGAFGYPTGRKVFAGSEVLEFNCYAGFISVNMSKNSVVESYSKI
jgi:hypothetical protein